mmetsp:Transcript_15041/g.39035  ORF Transcript_15041/g.39035 Transcript_15041/m.39035 type:complete len:313 (+) Transcript_15041:379-1317(+)
MSRARTATSVAVSCSMPLARTSDAAVLLGSLNHAAAPDLSQSQPLYARIILPVQSCIVSGETLFSWSCICFACSGVTSLPMLLIILAICSGDMLRIISVAEVSISGDMFCIIDSMLGAPPGIPGIPPMPAAAPAPPMPPPKPPVGSLPARAMSCICCICSGVMLFAASSDALIMAGSMSFMRGSSFLSTSGSMLATMSICALIWSGVMFPIAACMSMSGGMPIGICDAGVEALPPPAPLGLTRSSPGMSSSVSSSTSSMPSTSAPPACLSLARASRRVPATTASERSCACAAFKSVTASASLPCARYAWPRR